MDNPGEIMRLCRLCLVKDQVNIPIFDEQGDIRQIFLKISSCLPVKVSREDPLPKSICDGCSNKLDLLYEFRNTSANAEKTLLSWVGQADAKDVDETVTAAAHQVAKPSETQVKQEEVEESNPAPVQDIESMDAQESATFDESSAKDEEEEEPPPPKRARRTAAVKAQINIAPDSDDEDDDDDDLDGAEPMTKIEDESEESDDDKDPSYQDVPGTSADDQPGPSGVGKDGVEAPISTDNPCGSPKIIDSQLVLNTGTMKIIPFKIQPPTSDVTKQENTIQSQLKFIPQQNLSRPLLVIPHQGNSQIKVIPQQETGSQLIVIPPPNTDTQRKILPKKNTSGRHRIRRQAEKQIVSQQNTEASIQVTPQQNVGSQLIFIPQQKLETQLKVVPQLSTTTSQAELVPKQEPDSEQIISQQSSISQPQQNTDSQFIVIPQQQSAVADEKVISQQTAGGQLILMPQQLAGDQLKIIPQQQSTSQITFIPQQNLGAPIKIIPQQSTGSKLIVIPQQQPNSQIQVLPIQNSTSKIIIIPQQNVTSQLIPVPIQPLIQEGSERKKAKVTRKRRRNTENLPKKETLCPICGKVVKHFKKHLARHQHDKKRAKPKAYSPKLCALCGKMATSKHSHKNEFPCDQCNAVLKSEELRREHLEVHEGKYHECEYCHVVFKTLTELALHNYIHTKTYSCPKCKAVLKSKLSFELHMKREEKLFDYSCHICGKGYVDSRDLSLHLELHEDASKYECEFCDKKFKLKVYLQSHRRFNHKKELLGHEEVYQCDICDREFTFKRSLKRHMSMIHNVGENMSVTCEICGKVLSCNYGLKTHMNIHTGNTIFKCPICAEDFVRKQYLSRHMSNKHGTKKKVYRNINKKSRVIKEEIVEIEETSE